MKALMGWTGVLGFLALTGCASPSGSNAQEKRNHILTQSRNTLDMLYEQQDITPRDIEEAAGYATLTNVGTQVLLVGGDDGYGLVVDQETGEKTYVEVWGLDLGPGIGVASYRSVLVFKDQATIEKVISGQWNFGTDLSATASTEDNGGAAGQTGSFNKRIKVYTMGDEGLAATVNLRGMTVKPIKELN